MSRGNKILYITRQVEFCAAHRLYREELSESENFELFGKCANRHGHGHNYLLEATFKGTVSPATGMVVHLNTIKGLLHELVEEPLDHHNLNHDVPLMAGVLPTSENLLLRLWDQITRATADQPWGLHRLRLRSSANNWVEYLGEDAN